MRRQLTALRRLIMIKTNSAQKRSHIKENVDSYTVIYSYFPSTKEHIYKNIFVFFFFFLLFIERHKNNNILTPSKHLEKVIESVTEAVLR